MALAGCARATPRWMAAAVRSGISLLKRRRQHAGTRARCSCVIVSVCLCVSAAAAAAVLLPLLAAAPSSLLPAGCCSVGAPARNLVCWCWTANGRIGWDDRRCIASMCGVGSSSDTTHRIWTGIGSHRLIAPAAFVDVTRGDSALPLALPTRPAVSHRRGC